MTSLQTDLEALVERWQERSRKLRCSQDHERNMCGGLIADLAEELEHILALHKQPLTPEIKSNCRQCGGQGWYPVQTGCQGELTEQCQCERCGGTGIESPLTPPPAAAKK